jgi:proline iminopeptidase
MNSVLKKIICYALVISATNVSVLTQLAAYPIQSPYKEGYLQVSEIHHLFHAAYGNPEGIPVIILHGGPGGGSSDDLSCLFNLKRYHVIMFDQRGAMRSQPCACMEENTTQHILEDIEKLRNHFKISQWLVFGHSWGALLGVIYGQSHPESCLGFILSGFYLGCKEEINLFSDRVHFDPAAYQEFLLQIPPEERGDLIAASYRKVMDSDPRLHMPFARAFLRYQITGLIDPSDHAKIDQTLQNDHFVLSVARAVLHYAANGFFLEPNQILSHMHLLSHLPAIIIHADSDRICPLEQAQLLHKHWSNSKLWIVEASPHSIDSRMEKAVIDATNLFAESE